MSPRKRIVLNLAKEGKGENEKNVRGDGGKRKRNLALSSHKKKKKGERKKVGFNAIGEKERCRSFPWSREGGL